MYKAIRNGRFITPTGIRRGSVTIKKDGTIGEVTNKIISGDNVYDAGDSYVLPGLIETHGHLREPGMEYKEDIEHGTRAGLAGGFTTIFDMPNTKPPITTVDLVHEQINRYTAKSYCDFAINMGTSVDDIPQLEKIDPTEIAAVKVFTAGHQTTPTTIPKLSDQAKIWEIVSRRHIPLMVHAENQDLVTSREKMFEATGRNDMLAYSEARNELVVEMAAWEAVILAKYYGTSVWILHASTRGEFDAISYARKHGIKAGGEVTGYQLFFTTEDYKKLGTLIKVSPALRTPAVNKELWEMVYDGKVDGICSEHTPHTLEEKQGDIWKVTSGTPGLQETVPAFITGWVKRFGKKTIEKSLVTLARCAAGNVAQFFGFPQKSGIVSGNDADFVILDVDHEWVVQKKDLLTKLQWSAYEGMKLIGRPHATFLRGELVYEHGSIVGNHMGKWLKKGVS